MVFTPYRSCASARSCPRTLFIVCYAVDLGGKAAEQRFVRYNLERNRAVSRAVRTAGGPVRRATAPPAHGRCEIHTDPRRFRAARADGTAGRSRAGAQSGFCPPAADRNAAALPARQKRADGPARPFSPVRTRRASTGRPTARAAGQAVGGAPQLAQRAPGMAQRPGILYGGRIHRAASVSSRRKSSIMARSVSLSSVCRDTFAVVSRTRAASSFFSPRGASAPARIHGAAPTAPPDAARRCGPPRPGGRIPADRVRGRPL